MQLARHLATSIAPMKLLFSLSGRQYTNVQWCSTHSSTTNSIPAIAEHNVSSREKTSSSDEAVYISAGWVALSSLYRHSQITN